MSITDICNGIKDRLNHPAISGLHATAVVPAAPAYPAAYNNVRRIEYDRDFDGDMNVTIEVTIMVAAADLGRAQSNLFPYLERDGSKSIKAALEAPVHGQPWDSLTVKSFEGVEGYDVAGGQAVGGKFTCEVMA